MVGALARQGWRPAASCLEHDCGPPSPARTKLCHPLSPSSAGRAVCAVSFLAVGARPLAPASVRGGRETRPRSGGSRRDRAASASCTRAPSAVAASTPAQRRPSGVRLELEDGGRPAASAPSRLVRSSSSPPAAAERPRRAAAAEPAAARAGSLARRAQRLARIDSMGRRPRRQRRGWRWPLRPPSSTCRRAVPAAVGGRVPAATGGLAGELGVGRRARGACLRACRRSSVCSCSTSACSSETVERTLRHRRSCARSSALASSASPGWGGCEVDVRVSPRTLVGASESPHSSRPSR